MSPTATRTPTEEGTFDFGEAIRLEMAANPTTTRNQLAAIVARQIPRRDHVRVIEALYLALLLAFVALFAAPFLVRPRTHK